MVKKEIDFQSVVWKVLCDGDYAVVECRNRDELSVDFFSVNLKQPYLHPLRITFQNGEDWWWNLREAADGKAILSRTDREQTPVPKEISVYVYDIANGTKLWQLDDWRFHGFVEESKILCEHKEAGWCLADLENGDVLKTLQFQHYADYIRRFLEYETFYSLKKYTAPLLLREDSDAYAEWQNRILSLTALTPIGDIELAYATNSFTVAAFYAKNGAFMDNYLIVFRNNDVLTKDALAKNVELRADSHFLLYQDYLLYVVDKTRLMVMNLALVES